MADDKWLRRQPGSVSGTVVPPPVEDESTPPIPALPKRRVRSRPPSESRVAGSRFPGDPSADVPLPEPQLPAPALPDNVRLLFQPVIRAQEAAAGVVSGRPPDSTPVRIPCEPGTSGGVARHLVHGPELQDTASAASSADRSPGPGHRRHRRHRRHMAWLAAFTVVVLLTAAGTAMALLGQHGGSQHDARRGDNPVPGGGSGGVLSAGGKALAGAATARISASKWVAREVSRSAIIGCDSVMCSALVKAGVPSADLLVIRPGRQDPLGADVIVATPALRSQFGARLSTTYAPAVLARFGSGGWRIDVRVVAAYGAGAYQRALNRDLAARELLGTQIVGNSRIALPPRAQTELAAGQVDPRLLITLPALAHQHAIRVIAFYDRGPGASSGVPLSGAELAGSDPRAGLTSRQYLRWMINFLRVQRSVYRAAHFTWARQHGNAVVFVRFAQPYPIGLLH